MRVAKSDRGFEHLYHSDYVPGQERQLLAQSSVMGTYPDSSSRPGSSFLWIGDRHHLNREEVAALVQHLQAWLATGRLELSLPAKPAPTTDPPSFWPAPPAPS
jgi:hypothetical protein